MSPSETSPLLREGATQYSSLNEPIAIEDNDIHGNISVITTDGSSPKSTNIDDELLLRRLNGSPLMVVLLG
jgi:hypothetical protein